MSDTPDGLWNHLPVRCLHAENLVQMMCRHMRSSRLMRSVDGEPQPSIVLTCPDCGLNRTEQYADILEKIKLGKASVPMSQLPQYK